MQKLMLIFIMVFSILVLSSCSSLPENENQQPNVPYVIGSVNDVFFLEGTTDIPMYSSRYGLLSVFTYTPTNAQATSNKALDVLSRGKSQSSVVQQNKSLEDASDIHAADSHSFLRDEETRVLDMVARGEVPQAKLAPSYRSYTIGAEWDGVKLALDNNNVSTFDAELIYESTHAYYYEQIGYSKKMSASQVAAFADEFEKVYPQLVSRFATPSDTDNNGKIIVMFADFGTTRQNTIGYFYSIDKFSRTTYANSNEADIFYINLNFSSYDRYMSTTVSTLAHEFQHMMLFDQRARNIQSGIATSYANDTWLNEGLSMLAEVTLGYDIDLYITRFYQDIHDTSLTNWSGSIAGYGLSALFLTYLYDRFGSDQFIRDIYSSPYSGATAVEQVAKSADSGVQTDFPTLFKDFAVTLAIAGQTYPIDSRYSISTLNINSEMYGILGDISLPADEDFSVSLRPYSLYPVLWDGSVDELSVNEGIFGVAVPYN